MTQQIPGLICAPVHMANSYRYCDVSCSRFSLVVYSKGKDELCQEIVEEAHAERLRKQY